MLTDSAENKKPNLGLIILFVLIIIIVFFFTFGTYIPKSKSEKLNIYDDIDFGKLHDNLENEIKNRTVLLDQIRIKKEDLLKKITTSINFLKIVITGLWISINLSIYAISSKYTINEFIQFNEALIILLIFTLFMISEKFTNLHLAFEALKNGIISKLTDEFNLSLKIENKLKSEIYLLEAIYDVHPSIIQIKK